MTQLERKLQRVNSYDFKWNAIKLKVHKNSQRCFAFEMMVWASGVRTGQLFKTSGTEHPQCWRSRLHPCSSNDGCAFSCSQSHTPPGQRRCRGHRPCCPAAQHLFFLGGTFPAPSACSWGGSYLVETPPNGEKKHIGNSSTMWRVWKLTFFC